jgi:hypothetical protein
MSPRCLADFYGRSNPTEKIFSEDDGVFAYLSHLGVKGNSNRSENMNILFTILGFASAHIVVVFIAPVCVLSLIGIGVSEARSSQDLRRVQVPSSAASYREVWGGGRGGRLGARSYRRRALLHAGFEFPVLRSAARRSAPQVNASHNIVVQTSAPQR